MICGTTPTHVFEIPLLKSEIIEAWVMYAQGCRLILTKKTDALQIEDNKITCTLTQDETLKFEPRKMVDVQLKIKLTAGEVVASEITQVPAYVILDSDVI